MKTKMTRTRSDYPFTLGSGAFTVSIVDALTLDCWIRWWMCYRCLVAGARNPAGPRSGNRLGVEIQRPSVILPNHFASVYARDVELLGW